VKTVVPLLNDARFRLAEWVAVRRLAAAYELFALAGLTHRRPAYEIDIVKVGRKDVVVREAIVHRTPFGTTSERPNRGVLLVALMSGHFATLLRLIFQEYALPRGLLRWRGRKIDLRAIRRTALLTVEGEKDDICSLGQTLAAQDLCSSPRQFMRTHYIQAGAGHYGVFSGRRWAYQIYPVVREVVHGFQ
jgi:poly-beta-hydroxyalkanoate depolymerase